MRLLILFLFLILSSTVFAIEKSVTAIEDKKTFMGVIELPVDVMQPEALEIAKYIKQEIKLDQITVRQIGSRTHGIAIQSKYDGDLKTMESILEKIKSLVTKKFGKNTIAGWSMSSTIYTIQ